MHQQAHHLFGAFHAGGINHQAVGFGVHPHMQAALFGKGLRQQGEAHVVFDVAGFFFTGFAPRAGLDALGLLLRLLVHHAGRQNARLQQKLQNALTTNGLHQGTFFLATRRHPAKAAVHRGAAGDEQRTQ